MLAAARLILSVVGFTSTVVYWERIYTNSVASPMYTNSLTVTEPSTSQ